MIVLEQKAGCVLFENKRIEDNRGWFSVQMNADELGKYGFRRLQLNHSFTERSGVVRGLNYQALPYNRQKLFDGKRCNL